MSNRLLQYFGINNAPLMGIDISSSAIKIMQIGKKNNKMVVEHYGIEQLAPGVVVEKNIKNSEIVINALGKALQKSKVTTNLACISVPSSEAITRIIQLNRGLSQKEMASQIEIEADKYIPYDIDDVNLDFEVLGVSSKSEDLVDVLLAVSKTENINNRVELLSSVGVTVQIVDIDVYAIERAFSLVVKKLPEQGQKAVIGLIEIGATMTTLTVFVNMQAIYTKTQVFGGQHLISEIQSRYGLTYEEAVLARRYSNLPDDYITEVLTPFKETVVQQIKRICQFFYSSGDYGEIDYLFLTGGTANIAGIDELLSVDLGIKTFIANPLTEMLVSPEISVDALMSDAPILMGCCGLALRNGNYSYQYYLKNY